MVDFPFERTINNLVDLAFREGLGGLLAPWQLKRLEKAKAEANRESILMLADAEVRAKGILSGQSKLDNIGRIVASHENDIKDDTKALDVSARILPPLLIRAACY